MAMLVCRAVVLVICLGLALGFRNLMPKIPNADNVKNPCSGDLWNGVGHRSPHGAGDRNPFGVDVFTLSINNPNVPYGTIWTTDLCNKDSDGDGMTNGDELGDPQCTWTEGATPKESAQGHPGICEPVNSAKCNGKNGWAIVDC